MNEKKRYKLLVIGPDSPHVNNFLTRWDEARFDVQVISNGAQHISRNDVHLVDFSLKSLINYIRTPRRIRQIADVFQPDVVWLHQANSVSFFSVLGLKKRFPLVLTVWGSDILVAPRASKIIKTMTRYILKNVDLITADAKFLGDEALALSPKPNTPLHICQFGINPQEVQTDKERIIYSNRGHKALYRIPEIIKAFHRFQQYNPSEGRLVIAGFGAETEQLKTLVNDLELTSKVEFVGFLSEFDNATWYSRASLYISIPESDGTAVSLLEAMYYGCLPVVSDLPANREWISHGENGYVVKDLSENFIDDALQLDFNKGQTVNRDLILKYATPEASSERFECAFMQVLK
jgi:glycosyltransferase involved in cell wall biosynthesis